MEDSIGHEGSSSAPKILVCGLEWYSDQLRPRGRYRTARYYQQPTAYDFVSSMRNGGNRVKSAPLMMTRRPIIQQIQSRFDGTSGHHGAMKFNLLLAWYTVT